MFTLTFLHFTYWLAPVLNHQYFTLTHTEREETITKDFAVLSSSVPNVLFFFFYYIGNYFDD